MLIKVCLLACTVVLLNYVSHDISGAGTQATLCRAQLWSGRNLGLCTDAQLEQQAMDEAVDATQRTPASRPLGVKRKECTLSVEECARKAAKPKPRPTPTPTPTPTTHKPAGKTWSDKICWHIPLCDRAGLGKLPAVRELLAIPDVFVNEQDKYGISALRMAAYNGHASVVGALLKAGAKANLQDKNGATALMCAAQFGNASIVKVLLAAGARIDLHYTEPGTGKTATALDLAEGEDVQVLLRAPIQLAADAAAALKLLSDAVQLEQQQQAMDEAVAATQRTPESRPEGVKRKECTLSVEECEQKEKEWAASEPAQTPAPTPPSAAAATLKQLSDFAVKHIECGRYDYSCSGTGLYSRSDATTWALKHTHVGSATLVALNSLVSGDRLTHSTGFDCGIVSCEKWAQESWAAVSPGASCISGRCMDFERISPKVADDVIAKLDGLARQKPRSNKEPCSTKNKAGDTASQSGTLKRMSDFALENVECSKAMWYADECQGHLNREKKLTRGEATSWAMKHRAEWSNYI